MISISSDPLEGVRPRFDSTCTEEEKTQTVEQAELPQNGTVLFLICECDLVWKFNCDQFTFIDF